MLGNKETRLLKKMIKRNSIVIEDIWYNVMYDIGKYAFEEQIKTDEIFILKKVNNLGEFKTIARYYMGNNRLIIYSGHEEDIHNINNIFGKEVLKII